MRRTDLCLHMQSVLDLIDDRIDSRCRWLCRLEFFRRVIGLGTLDVLPESERSIKSACNRVTRKLIANNESLAKAFYVEHRYLPTDAYLKETYGVHQTELTWLRDQYSALVKQFGADRVLKVERRPAWTQSVEEERSFVTAWIGDTALQDILFSAIESYRVPQKGKRSSSEVYGLCFGSTKSSSKKLRSKGIVKSLDVRVDRVILQLRADAGSAYVFPNEKTQETHLSLVKDVFPWLDLVGDFHTHPYRDHKATHFNKGWKHSDADNVASQEWMIQMREMEYRPRLCLIAAISSAKRRSGVPARYIAKENVLCTCLAGHHVWMSAYRILGDGSLSDKKVTLRCHHFESA